MIIGTCRALLIVDVQRDFCEGGALAVPGGAACATAISRYLADHRNGYIATYASADWHIDPGAHFASFTQTEADYVDTWPDHCVAGTPGAQFHPNFASAVDHVVRKGMHTAAYSAFEGIDPNDATLAELLDRDGIDALDVCGIATSHCVHASATDALAAGYLTRVLEDLTVGVTPESRREALDELRSRGAHIA